jgi:hypothetical protein
MAWPLLRMPCTTTIRRYFMKEQRHAGVDLHNVTQLKQPITNRPGQRLPVILPMPQFCHPGDHGSEVIRITGLQLIRELLHRARPAAVS